MIYDQFFDFSRQLNVNVMAYEYSGYGKATGAPSEENCYADIDAAFKYLVEVRASAARLGSACCNIIIICHGRPTGPRR